MPQNCRKRNGPLGVSQRNWSFIDRGFTVTALGISEFRLCHPHALPTCPPSIARGPPAFWRALRAQSSWYLSLWLYLETGGVPPGHKRQVTLYLLLPDSGHQITLMAQPGAVQFACRTTRATKNQPARQINATNRSGGNTRGGVVIGLL